MWSESKPRRLLPFSLLRGKCCRCRIAPTGQDGSTSSNLRPKIGLTKITYTLTILVLICSYSYMLENYAADATPVMKYCMTDMHHDEL